MSIEPYFNDDGLCNDPYCPLCNGNDEEYDEELEEDEL